MNKHTAPFLKHNENPKSSMTYPNHASISRTDIHNILSTKISSPIRLMDDQSPATDSKRDVERNRRDGTPGIPLYISLAV